MPDRDAREAGEHEARFGPDALARIRAMSGVIAQQLRGCTKRELEVLICYYIKGQSEEKVLAQTGFSREEFGRLRRRLRGALLSTGPDKPPRANAAAAG